MKTFICILMAALLTNAPHVAVAEVAAEMIPTSVVVDEMTRAQRETQVREILSRQELQIELEKYGLTKSEVSKRLATLSDAELRQMSKQMDEARFGGEPVTGILIIVLLVLAIIYLAKRV